MIGHFVSKPEELIDLMRETGTIISGPFALRYLEGRSREWADDLDLYTPHDSYKAVVDFFKARGYRAYTPKCAEPNSTAAAKRYGR